jgi:hypothetical protein
MPSKAKLWNTKGYNDNENNEENINGSVWIGDGGRFPVRPCRR